MKLLSYICVQQKLLHLLFSGLHQTPLFRIPRGCDLSRNSVSEIQSYVNAEKEKGQSGSATVAKKAGIKVGEIAKGWRVQWRSQKIRFATH